MSNDIILENSLYSISNLNIYEIDEYKEYMEIDKINEISKTIFEEKNVIYEINKDTKKYICIDNITFDILYSIKTENKIDKVYVLINERIIHILNPQYINGIYQLNGEYGIYLHYYDKLNIVITFKDREHKIEAYGGKYDFEQPNKINIFASVMRSFNIKKLYGIPYHNNTYYKLEKIEFI